MTLLIVTADDAPALAAGQALALGLQAAGLPVLGVAACHMLVREVVRLAPSGVVLLAARLDVPLQAALALLAASAPRPVLVVGAAAAPVDVPGLIDARVMAWLPGPCHAPALSAAFALAMPRFEREQQQGAALAAAEARLDERKWVDRAKGVLMHHQRLSEDDAFTLLRTASMQANLRVGEVSRGLIEAAQAADAVNRAGQLRMLSQRYVLALALRAMPRPRPDDPLAETVQRLQANLDHLAVLLPGGPAAALLAATAEAWQGLRALGMPDATGRAAAAAALLARADELAELLLAQADALTGALEASSGRRNLRLINLCGRQRMLSQRLAKQALLAGLLPEAAERHAAAAAQTVREFETALLALEQAPLATEAIRAALAQARGQWQRLLDGLRRAGGHDAALGRAMLARESEALLGSFEQLTSLYEHSMQVLLG
jgi:AmiR/NasT family two-component response regulator